MSGLPEWAAHALNGSSVRSPKPWRLAELVPDDFLAGAVAQRSKWSLDIAIEAGSYKGEPLEPGEWRRVEYAKAAIVRRFVARDDPQPGDRVVIRYLGHTGVAGRGVRYDFAAGVAREEQAEAWE